MNDCKDKQQQNNPVPPPYPYYVVPQDDEMKLKDLWGMLVKNKKLILFLTCISTAIALTYALIATPVYRAETILAPVTGERANPLGAITGQFSGLASLAGINIRNADGGSIEIAIATLKSREFTNRFIEDEALMPVLFEGKWDANAKQWKESEGVPTLWDAYEKFNQFIRIIHHDKKTGLITLSIDWNDPVLAAEWANKLVARLNTKLRQEAILDSEKSIKYLEGELQKTSIIEIKDSIYSLIEAQTKIKMLANTKEEYAFRVLDYAVIPEKRIKPKRTMIVVFGFLIGGALGIFFAVVRQANFAQDYE